MHGVTQQAKPIPHGIVLPDDGFTVIIRGSEVLRIHPSRLAAFVSKGWKVWPATIHTEH